MDMLRRIIIIIIIINLTAVREMSGILLKIRQMSGNCHGKNLVREKLPKAVYCNFVIAYLCPYRYLVLVQA